MDFLDSLFNAISEKKVESSTTDSATYLIVGLGNPGREYRETRHNIGFMAVDAIANSAQCKLTKVQSKAIMGIAQLEEKRVILAKPQTYMNLSGQAVSGLMRFYKIPVSCLMVINDDLDLPLGTLRMRPGGGSAGQKGIGSIIEKLGTQEFPRMRLGIGRPPGQMESADYVLQPFSQSEHEMLDVVLERAVKAACIFVHDGLEAAMNQFNGNIS